MRGKPPTIGPQDFQRLARICQNATHEAERLEACGYPKLARELRDIAYRTANIDSELYRSEP